MLTELKLTDLGVIPAATLEFSPGLTVLTGETGAGKTMVLNGLAMVMGERVSPSLIRAGCDVAEATAYFKAPPDSSLAEEILSLNADLDDGEVIITRIQTQSRSRATVGGKALAVSRLRELLADLVTVHGQAEQNRLKSDVQQRELLDAYGGSELQEAKQNYRIAWTRWQAAERELAEFLSAATTRAAELVQYQEQLALIAEVNPGPDELSSLQQQIKVSESLADIHQYAGAAYALLASEHDQAILTGLAQVRRSLQQVADVDPQLTELTRQLSELDYSLNSIASELGIYLQELAVDGHQLDVWQRRLHQLTRLERLLGINFSEIPEYQGRLERFVADYADLDSARLAREQNLATATERVHAAAAELSAVRQRAAESLSAAVSKELSALAMAAAEFTVSVAAAELNVHGADAIGMLLRSHPQAPALPITQAASGGELSRIMLALEVVLAQSTTKWPQVFLFDEVDAGIGGATAVAVAMRLKALAEQHQVIVVTHLAQVAAQADKHLLVAKNGAGRTEVSEVTGSAREQEIARMLSGQGDSPTALAHARELLKAD